MLGLAFCSVGGVLATYIEDGRLGLKELARRCVLYRVPAVWWLYAVGISLAVHLIAIIIYGEVHGKIGPFRPLELLHRWWLFYIFVFGFFQGPLAEEFAWRGLLLPRLLRKWSPLAASLMLGLTCTVWHLNVFFSPLPYIALFAASLIAFTVLGTLLFVHTRGSILLVIVMHWSVMSQKYVATSLLPLAQEPPDWLRAVVVMVIAITVIVVTGGTLGARKTDNRVEV